MIRIVVLSAVMIACLLSASCFAGDYYSPAGPTPTVKIGPDGTMATDVRRVFGKEYSHSNWFSLLMAGGDPRLTNVEDHDEFAVADPLQVVSWDGKPGPIGMNSGSTDAFDYGVDPNFNFRDEGQVDALAHRNDLLFDQVVANTATLLFSSTADIDAMSMLPGGPIVAKDHVHFEAPTGAAGSWALIEAAPVGPGLGPGVNHHVVEDLDALEVWGPEPPGHGNPNDDPVREGFLPDGTHTADANRFSLDGDASNMGTSVFGFDIPSKTVFPYIFHSTIVDAVEDLLLGPGMDYDTSTRDNIDVDGTMVKDRNLNDEWDMGDELLFTIDPLDAPMDPAGALLAPVHGGEIMHLVNTGAGTFSISFLMHGGHLWDTAFSPAAAFGYFYEDVDALEAVGTVDGGTDINTPEPTSLVLMCVALLSVCSIRRRERDV